MPQRRWGNPRCSPQVLTAVARYGRVEALDRVHANQACPPAAIRAALSRDGAARSRIVGAAAANPVTPPDIAVAAAAHPDATVRAKATSTAGVLSSSTRASIHNTMKPST